MRGFYRFVALEQKRDVSPADDLQAPRAWAALPKFLDLEDVDRLLAAPDTVDAARPARQGADRSALRDRPARLGAGRASRPDDLHLDEGYLTCIGKGDKERIVPLGQEAADWVRRYIRDGRPALLAKRGSPWLFVNARDGGPLSRVGFWKVLKEYGIKAGIARELARTSCATRSRRTFSSAAPTCAMIQMMLGHADLSTTQIYTHVLEARLRAVYDKFHPRNEARSTLRCRPEPTGACCV